MYQGICDRHNDNIMVTTSGNLFHIDFGKFLGDAQMMAGFRRDRAPFVFTADMAYVINEGDRPSKSYQFFVDLCCRCFILVRQNGDFLLSLLSMMIRSGIFGLSPETIKYFHNALMPNLMESQAKVEFHRLIDKALKSFATQFNFFIHSIAQSLSGSGSGGGAGSNGTQEDRSGAVQDMSSMDGAKSSSAVGDESSLSESASQFSFTKIRFSESPTEHITHLEIVDHRCFDAYDRSGVFFYKVRKGGEKWANFQPEVDLDKVFD